MEFNWLKDFIALAECRNFSRAAEERYVSQPAFSRRIRVLETTVGARLINRETLPLSLTPAGDLFLEQARAALQAMDETIERCRAIDSEDERMVRLAASQSLYLSYVNDEFLPLSSDITLDLNSVSWPADRFVASLQQGYSDLILVYWHPMMSFLAPLGGAEFTYQTLVEDVLIPVSKPDSNGAAMFNLSPQDPPAAGSARANAASRHPKDRLPVLSYGRDSVFRAVVDDLLSGHKNRPLADAAHDTGMPSVLQVSQNALSNSVKAMILEGFGLGWLPRRMCLEELASGALVIAGNERFQAPLEIRAYRMTQSSKPLLETFWAELRAMTPRTAPK
ncbi:LysR family transcriptional regulator [Albirhodobacter sp. R86504]|uniref:LysR family transcriptional regulator n=1 Tax=Albirhodobacter sp. R86504 TaxID=3093848 RepID=UPI0036733A16